MQSKSFYKVNPIGPLMGLLNEVLCILVAQAVAKQPEVKVGDTKKNPGLKLRLCLSGAGLAKWQNFFSPPTLTFGNSAVS